MTYQQQKYPRFFDVLCAAVLTLWIIAFVSICVTFILQNSRTLWDAVAFSFTVLSLGGVTVFILGGAISLPIWMICKFFLRLSHNISGLIGGATGLIISAFILWQLSRDFSGSIIISINQAILIVATLTTFGAFAGWNGYRVAWNGRLDRKGRKR